jgi:hypothetical protein
MNTRAVLCAGWLMCAAAGAFAATGEGFLSAASEDIREIRGPRPPQLPLPWPVLAAGAAVLAGLGYAVYRWQRRRKPITILSPHELALQRLEALRAQMPALGTTAFAVAASDIVRNYIEVRFGVTVTRRTTDEFLQDLLASPDSALSQHRPLLNEFLRRCDYAKFAGSSVALESVEGMYRGAQTFVTETAPQEPHDSVSAA